MILASVKKTQQMTEDHYEMVIKHKLFRHETTVHEVMEWARRISEYAECAVTIERIDPAEEPNHE